MMATMTKKLPTILDMGEAADLLGVSKVWLHKLRQADEMPPPDVVLGQSSGWLEETLLEWWDERSGA